MLTGPSFPRPHRRLCPASADGGRAAGRSDPVAGRLRALSTRNLGAIAVALVVASYRAIRACRLGSPVHPNGARLSQERPRAEITISVASPFPVQVTHSRPLRIEMHSNTERLACASTRLGHRIQGSGA